MVNDRYPLGIPSWDTDSLFTLSPLTEKQMPPFTLLVQIEIKKDQIDKFMPLALENARATRETEPGCRQFDVLVDPADTSKIMFYEIYDDEAAFSAHQQTAHFRKYVDNALQYLDSRTRIPLKRVAP
jgi:(4S)-4-hydroxy-5-phosphonooxypentane-2,3-dione isomerase